MRYPTVLLIVFLFTMCACGGGAGEDEQAPSIQVSGEAIFNTNCALCHGRKGDLGMSGAKDLTKSTLKREEMIAIIAHGKGNMMPYTNVLKPEEIELVVDHALTLRTAP